MTKQNTVTIPLKEYADLQAAKEELDALHAGGVDNWEWYEESIAPLQADDPDAADSPEGELTTLDHIVAREVYKVRRQLINALAVLNDLFETVSEE